jgi:ABC-type transport system involved in multi-copper enzyme maturation permease subunit
VNKALGIFALCWVAVVAVLNIAAVTSILVNSRDLTAASNLRMAIFLLIVLLLLDAVLCTPALAAEWLRSMRIARVKLRKHGLH